MVLPWMVWSSLMGPIVWKNRPSCVSVAKQLKVRQDLIVRVDLTICLPVDSTISCDKPVIFVGSMRPSTAVSADGPANLLQAVRLATSPEAKGRGVMVTLNDRIGSAFYIQKTNANTLDTFHAEEQGYLGAFLNNRPVFYYGPTRSTFYQRYNVSGVDSLPKVDMLMGYVS